MKQFSNSVREYFIVATTDCNNPRLCWDGQKWIVNRYFGPYILNKIGWEVCF